MFEFYYTNERLYKFHGRINNMVEKMTTKDYDRYKSAISVANDEKDKVSLKKIQMQLIARYGLDNDDVKNLLNLFRYNV